MRAQHVSLIKSFYKHLVTGTLFFHNRQCIRHCAYNHSTYSMTLCWLFTVHSTGEPKDNYIRSMTSWRRRFDTTIIMITTSTVSATGHFYNTGTILFDIIHFGVGRFSAHSDIVVFCYVIGEAFILHFAALCINEQCDTQFKRRRRISFNKMKEYKKVAPCHNLLLSCTSLNLCFQSQVKHVFTWWAESLSTI